jgi:hypothetical protein
LDEWVAGLVDGEGAVSEGDEEGDEDEDEEGEGDA